MVNPFKSPAQQTLLDPRISDRVVRRLVDGRDIEELAFYDASDCHIYGRRHRRRLSGKFAADAKSAGCDPVVYQTVLWFCLVYFPIWPIATYFVMPFAEYDETDDDAIRYRAVLAPFDAGQVASHCVLLFSIVFVVATTVWYCCR